MQELWGIKSNTGKESDVRITDQEGKTFEKWKRHKLGKQATQGKGTSNGLELKYRKYICAQ